MPIPTGNLPDAPPVQQAQVSRVIEEDTVVFQGDGLRLELSLARWALLGSPNEVTISKLI